MEMKQKFGAQEITCVNAKENREILLTLDSSDLTIIHTQTSRP
jgi:hypothetical protein